MRIGKYLGWQILAVLCAVPLYILGIVLAFGICNSTDEGDGLTIESCSTGGRAILTTWFVMTLIVAVSPTLVVVTRVFLRRRRRRNGELD